MVFCIARGHEARCDKGVFMNHMTETNITELVDRYLETWNETDATRRRQLITQTWTEKATYLDPLMQGEGYEGIDAMLQGVQAQFPKHVMRRVGEVDAHHDRVRFAWGRGPKDGTALVRGIDVGVVSDDGRLESITGFLDQVPQ
jgi:SnoaL-like domain